MLSSEDKSSIKTGGNLTGFLPEDSATNILTKMRQDKHWTTFCESSRTISSIKRTAGSSRPLSSPTADTIATIDDTVKVKLQIFYLLRRVLFPVSNGTQNV